MPAHRLIATALTCLLLAGGCALLRDEATASEACQRALTRSGQVAEDRARALQRTARATDVDPEHVAETLAHRDDAQRVVFGPAARLATRADQRADAYRRLRGECRTSGEVPERCQEAFSLSTRLSSSYADATRRRVDVWSEQLTMARSAMAGRADATRQAIARWDRMLTAYENQVVRLDRATRLRAQAATDCRDAL